MSIHKFLPMGCVCALAVGSSAHASILVIGGNVPASAEQTGATFSGTLDYTFDVGTRGVLVVSLTNQSTPAIGGFLTAFVFNVGGPAASGATQLSGPNANWTEIVNGGASPFGSPFDAGSSTGSGFEGGGPPSRGLAPGATGSWSFEITASDAATLTEESFLNGPFEFNFVVRFRGLSNGGSDKVPALIVPAPGALAMLGIAALGTSRRRR